LIRKLLFCHVEGIRVSALLHGLERLDEAMKYRLHLKEMHWPLTWQHPLVPEVTLALIVKLVLILAAALFVFSPSQRPKIDSAGMADRLLGASPALDSKDFERDAGAKSPQTFAHPAFAQPRSYQP